ncbi:hypothetical protein [Mobilitalea sibirica]|nr:hypothetical protein [Mobilitalea sibirica]
MSENNVDRNVLNVVMIQKYIQGFMEENNDRFKGLWIDKGLLYR